MRDIAERKQAEDALRESETRFRGVFDASPIPILLSTIPEGRLLEANAAALSAFGYARDEVIGKTTVELGVWASPERRAEFLQRVAAEGSVTNFEATLRTKARTGRVMLCTGTTLTIAGRACAVTSAVEITAVRKAEAERAEIQRKMFQNQKYEALGTLAGGIAHDFNNILTGVINYTSLARHDCPSTHPQIAHYLGQVLHCGQRAKELVRQILLFSRAEDAERGPLRLQPVLQEALDLLRSTIPAAVAIQSDLDELTPLVLGNATQIHQVVLNLGINAAHAMQERGGVLRVVLRERMVDPALAGEILNLRPGAHVCVEFSDTGCGMEPAVVARIFEPFFTTKKVGEGTGLGLAVVHSVMATHQGAITVRSQPGAGTTFELFFPVHLAAPVARAAEPGEIPRGRGQRILFVDDEPAIASSQRLILEQLGYRVTTFTRPEEALAHFETAPDAFDVVITDYQMAGMTGIDLARKIRAHRPALPVFLVSGFASNTTPDKIRDAGITGFLRKPIELAELVETITRALPR